MNLKDFRSLLNRRSNLIADLAGVLRDTGIECVVVEDEFQFSYQGEALATAALSATPDPQFNVKVGKTTTTMGLTPMMASLKALAFDVLMKQQRTVKTETVPENIGEQPQEGREAA